MAQGTELLSLPDELLLQVMGNLTTSDILTLARTCRRLRGLQGDRSLWVDVDLRQSSLRARQLSRLLRHLHAETRRVCVGGHVRRDRPLSYRPPVLTAHCLTGIRDTCEALEELRLERCLLNAKELPLDLLPSTLVSLSLRGSEVTHRPIGRSYFHRLWELVPYLTDFDLTGCGWVDSHALLPLSKLQRLRRLTLRRCRRLGGEIAYSSIACMLGFRELRELDVRGTQVADSDVSGFCQLPRLQALLLEPCQARLLSGDATLRSLGQHRGREMQQLALRGCPLTDEAALKLPELLPGLRQLDLTDASVSTERRQWLAEQLPACVISCHESQPAPQPEPEREPEPEPEPEPGRESRLQRKRRRSLSPDAPASKRSRRCQCVPCASGSDVEDAVVAPPEWDELREEERPVAGQVIVVNLFAERPAGARQPGERALGEEAANAGQMRRLVAVVNDGQFNAGFAHRILAGRGRAGGVVPEPERAERDAVLEPGDGDGGVLEQEREGGAEVEQEDAVVEPAGQRARVEEPAGQEAALEGPDIDEAAVEGSDG